MSKSTTIRVEVWVKRTLPGVFITQEVSECVDTLDVSSKAEGDTYAQHVHGARAYTVLVMR